MESTKNETQSNQNRRVIRKNQSESNAISRFKLGSFVSALDFRGPKMMVYRI